MIYNHILAKSSKNSDTPECGETLIGHTQKVMQSFKFMFGTDADSPTRLATEWLRFFKLKQEDFRIFHINALIACGLHDIGKANSGFQDVVQKKKGIQVIRHEHLSGLILWLPKIREWLKQIPNADFRIIFSAVISHHLKAGYDDFAKALEPDILKIFRIFPKAIHEIFCHVGMIINGKESEENFEIPELWEFGGASESNPYAIRDRIIKSPELDRFKRELRKNSDLNGLFMALRAALILADSSGSAIAREKKDIKEWLATAFGEISDGKYIEENVIQPRIRVIREKQQGHFDWDEFQNTAESLPKRALMLSPCGSGKTLAAWRWIKAQLNQKPTARVIFLYPTRATATEGFRDYVSWAPESDASLIHGTSEYELEDMFTQPEDERHGKDFSTEDRMYALGYWHKRIFSATVDQFLGFMQHSYRSVCLLPLLADSVIVFDEVHSFDKSLFSALKLFLKNFDIPALCMTASLPPMRRKELKDCGLTLFPEDITQFEDLEKKASMERYEISLIRDASDAEDIVAGESGKRILWVVNKVDRCQTIAKKYPDSLCYHSRFRLDDRKSRHEEVITAFQQKENAALAITTQVCEMSLDLDADILISEAAPIPAMIQRMGRCNRHAKSDDNIKGKVFFYMPEDEKPYSNVDLKGCKEFLDEIDGKDVSQVMLENLLEKYGQSDKEIEKYSAFLKDGAWAVSREQSLRDESDYTINALLDNEIYKYFAMRKQKKSVDGLLVPVPKKFIYPHPKLGRFPLAAPSTHYDRKYGFSDSPSEEIL